MRNKVIMNLWEEIVKINTVKESDSLCDTAISLGEIQMKNKVLDLIREKFFNDVILRADE